MDAKQRTMTPGDIAVVYIARGNEGGLQSAQRFVSSYMARRAGCAHTLHVITKGWRSDEKLSSLRSSFEQVQPEFVPLPDDGFDLGAYFRAAAQIQSTWLLCLNTHSVILADDWVRLLFDAASAPGVGAAGATGSWESHTTSILRLPKPDRALARLQRVAKSIWVRYHFPRFPNAHLRTNAFMIRRSELLEFAARTRMPSSKKDVAVIESGRSGLTAFLRRKNLRVVVCGTDGKVFPVNAWHESRTYFAGGQTNLLVGDNRTRQYAEADNLYRYGMQVAAWGRVDDSLF